jgi:enoyl-CoA hydratase/carnithine racemase
MFYETLTVKRKDNVMLIRMAWPVDIEKMARLSDELAELSTEITWDEEVWMTVITRDGEKSFSMGKLLEEAASSAD